MPTLKRTAPKAAKKARVHDEMSKFKAGSLKSSSGQKVTNPKQAVAIAMSESGQKKGPTPEQKAALTKKNTKLANRRPRNRGRS